MVGNSCHGKVLSQSGAWEHHVVFNGGCGMESRRRRNRPHSTVVSRATMKACVGSNYNVHPTLDQQGGALSFDFV